MVNLFLSHHLLVHLRYIRPVNHHRDPRRPSRLQDHTK